MYRLPFFMQYDKEILRVLAEAGDEGLSVQNISRHVFNACNSFFNPIDQEEVRKYVQSYLLKNSKTANALLAKNKKGVYKLNANNQLSEQLLFQFHDEPEVYKEKPIVDQSLSLFDD